MGWKPFPNDMCEFHYYFQNCSDISRWFQNFPDGSKTVWIFPEDFKIFQTVSKLFGYSQIVTKLSGQFQSCPDLSIWFQNLPVGLKLNRHFQIISNYPDCFKTVWLFTDYLKIFQTVSKLLSKLFGHFQMISKLSSESQNWPNISIIY